VNAWTELLEAAREYRAATRGEIAQWRKNALGRVSRRLDAAILAIDSVGDQPSLFDQEPKVVVLSDLSKPEIGKFRATDPDTSREAAVAMYPHAKTLQRKLLTTAYNRPDRSICAFEAMQATGLDHNNASTRLSELKGGGWLEWRGKDRRKNPKTGRGQRVYYVTTAAIEKIERKR
jgi:hypothetical protein